MFGVVPDWIPIAVIGFVTIGLVIAALIDRLGRRKKDRDDHES